MSDRMTGIRPRQKTPGVGGMHAYGRKSRAEMLADFRSYHANQLEHARTALALSDDDLIVETFLGTYAQRSKTEVTE